MNATREEVVRLARGWIGTPYHHQASVTGVGTDCLGLVRGVWRELYGRDPELPPAYTRDWAEASGRETLLDAARRHLVERDRSQILPGDVLIFRLRPSLPAKHATILTTPSTMVHAMERCPVSEVAFSPWWRRHLAAAFSFSEILD
jgi:NlpC/P60 family putative phage cell wall peptidase